MGTDEKAIISVLGNRNSFQRKLIRLAYEEIYHEDLIHQLKSEISGDFEVNFLMFTSFTCMDFYLSLHVLLTFLIVKIFCGQ